MTEIIDFGTLKTGVVNYSHRSDLDSIFPLLIRATESRINRLLRHNKMLKRSVKTISDSYVSLPSDFISIDSIHLGDRVPVLLKTGNQQSIDRNSQEISYSIENNTIEIRPNVVDDIDLEIVYMAKVDKLTADADTNDILLALPMIYLYGMMIDVALFSQDDNRVAMWETAFTKEVDLANENSVYSRYSGSPLTIKGN